MPVFTRSNSVMMERYRCAICQDLLIEPVSVTCGHTFCRLCLARWTLQCKQTRCAGCQKFWIGQPHVNIVLRETIQELFPEAYEEKANQHAEEANLINHFDLSIRAMLEKQQRQIQSAQNNLAQVAQQQQNKTNEAFLGGVFIAAIVAVVVYLLGFGPSETYVSKPVDSWSLLDCMHWLETMGDWTKDTLIPKFASQKLDGKYLMQLSSDDTGNLEEIISNETKEHQQLLQKAFRYISVEGRVPPSDLWEYKDVYPLKSLVLLEIVFSFPRLGTLLMFVFDYRSSFLPVIHCVTSDMNISMYDTDLPSPSYAQYLQFGVRMLVFPLMTVYTPFLFTALWTTNPWAMLYTCLRACLACTYDVTTVFVILQDAANRIQLLKSLRAAFITGNITYFSLYLVSWILPRKLMQLVCSCFFYFNFLVLPLKDTIICLPIIYKFVNHLRSRTRQEIWVEIQEIGYTIGPVFQSFIHYLSHQFLDECKTFAKNAFSVITDIGSGIYNYLRCQAVEDIWWLLKAIHQFTIRICMFIDRYTLGMYANNEN